MTDSIVGSAQRHHNSYGGHHEDGCHDRRHVLQQAAWRSIEACSELLLLRRCASTVITSAPVPSNQADDPHASVSADCHSAQRAHHLSCFPGNDRSQLGGRTSEIPFVKAPVRRFARTRRVATSSKGPSIGWKCRKADHQLPLVHNIEHDSSEGKAPLLTEPIKLSCSFAQAFPGPRASSLLFVALVFE